MKYYSNTIFRLPDEILFFRTIITKEKDPIKKYVFSLKELIYIMKRISKLSIDYDEFINIHSLNNRDLLLHLLSLNYLGKNISLNKEYRYLKDFFRIFFDYRNPFYDEATNKVWFYPKLAIKNFINNSLFYNLEFKYFDEVSLNLLINIFSNFTKYEYENSKDICFLFKDLNYPSLILANIDLYEKGYINVVEDSKEIKIFLNMKPKTKNKFIFTTNKILLKQHILKFINSKENLKYSLCDFL